MVSDGHALVQLCVQAAQGQYRSPKAVRPTSLRRYSWSRCSVKLMYWSSAFLLMWPNRFSSVLTCRGGGGGDGGGTGRTVRQRLGVPGEGETRKAGQRREESGPGQGVGESGRHACKRKSVRERHARELNQRPHPITRPPSLTTTHTCPPTCASSACRRFSECARYFSNASSGRLPSSRMRFS